MKPTEFDIKNAHLHHRCHVRNAKAIIDNHPPLLHARNFARFAKMKEDIEILVTRFKQNAQLLVALNKVARTRGEIDSFRTTENSLTPNYCKLSQKYQLLEKLDFENSRIGKKLLCAQPKLDTWLSDIFKRKVPKKKPPPFHYPELIMSKYSHIEIPQNTAQLQACLRPKIWFNLEIKNLRPLGLITIELFTEAAPQVVLEFVRLCHAKQNDRVHFIRLFSRLWMEGEILLDDKTLIRKNIEFDKRSIDHGQHLGVLSFNLKNLKSIRKSIFNFTLSFKPLRVCNGSRVGFGRVCRGFKVLNCIEDFGTKNGKMSKEIVVSNCGILM